MNVIRLEAAVVERVGLVADLVETLGVEFVAIDDQDAARAEIGNVRDQASRVHCYQGVDGVARRVNIAAGKMDLKSADARFRTARRPNLSGKIGERRDVVA